ncbi:MAG: LLM class flavin-dependent oxidoreductase [Gammaproteobacteria bacterium]
MQQVRYGVALGDLTMSARECVRLGPLVEDWGYDAIWMADHLIDIDGAVADPYAVFGYLAALTERITFCAAVSDTQRMHPAKMAHIVATLDELSGGRIGLGIGAGEAMSTLPFGLPFEGDPAVRLARLREYIEVVKRLWASSAAAPVSFTGTHYTLDGAWLDQAVVTRPHPPVHVGALGSRAALRIAAELGDGWMPFFSTPGYFRQRLDYLQAHARRVGRDPSAIEPSVWVYLVLTDDAALATEKLRELAVFSVAERGSLKHAGFDLASLPSAEFNFSRLVVSDAARLERLAAAAAQVPLALVREMHAVGDVAEVTRLFSAHIAAGVRHFIINPCASPDVDATLARFAAEVRPRLARAQ